MSVAMKRPFDDVSSYQSGYYGTAVSEDAKRLSDIYKNAIDTPFFESTTLNIDEVFDGLLEDYGSENWDGYGASPITASAVEKAKQFLTAIPGAISQPEVDASSSGEISFEWYKDPAHIFVVEINKTGDLNFAGLFGHRKNNGVSYFDGNIPQEIISHILSIQTLK